MLNIKEIQLKYRKAILKSQKLYRERKVQDTAGAVRYTKGQIVAELRSSPRFARPCLACVVEEITKDIIRIAWSKISDDKSRLKMNKKSHY
jgi:repressor of nif and glnA expression